MATKTQTKSKPKTTVKTTTVKAANEGPVSAVAVARATVAKGNGAHDNVYEDAVKEVVALSENDTYAKKIDNGPLSEARGKDTWRLHAQLRAVDQVDKNISAHVSTLQTALHDIDQHLHADTVAVTDLVSDARGDVQKWITGTHAEVGEWVTGTKNALATQLTKSTDNIQGDIESLTSTVKESFAKLAQATAGTEENLRSQTDAFSKAVENLLGTLQHDMDRKIAEFRDESTRLIDKRFNQSDVAFAAVRADQEVIKALLTDIIKDRLGRSEPRNR